MPQSLNNWLMEHQKLSEREPFLRCDGSIKVVLGATGSYVAWSSRAITSQGIPTNLQQLLQSWWGDNGWIRGPPQLITLGADGSYFVVSGSEGQGPATYEWYWGNQSQMLQNAWLFLWRDPLFQLDKLAVRKNWFLCAQ